MTHMGYFSWDCKGCTHSIRGGHRDDWMTKAVVLDKEGSVIVGAYDGYGRVGDGGTEIQNIDDPEVWHHACYLATGKPEYSGPSRSARDQGLTNYDLTRPRHQQDVEGLRDWKQNQLRALREKTKEVWKQQNDEARAKGEEVPEYALRFETQGE